MGPKTERNGREKEGGRKEKDGKAIGEGGHLSGQDQSAEGQRGGGPFPQYGRAGDPYHDGW